jgi:hypothetical protein
VLRRQARYRDPNSLDSDSSVVMILPQVHLRKPCYDFTFL